MNSAPTIVYCPCCGRDKPAYDYPAGKQICSLCAMLDANTAVVLARETAQREHSVRAYTASGRKQSRVAAKLALYETAGKRCSGCHHRKPPSGFNKCAPTPDGLQPMCKSCNKIWLAARASGGTRAWHTIRDALRATSPEGK